MTEQNNYTISVVIPAYNAGKYVGRAIDSVLAQTLAPHEVIVVDDGSTDNTAQVVAQYQSKVKYIVQENAGASVARNTGIKTADGEWIAFLDADDEWLPQKLHLQTELLDRNPDIVWTTGNYLTCVCSKNLQAPSIETAKAIELLDGKEYSDSFFRAFLKKVWGCTDSMIIRRDALIEAGMFRPGQLRGNDFDMWWRIAYRYPKIGYLAEPTAIYHLDIEGSIIRKHTDGAISRELIHRHLELAQQHNRIDDFTPCAVHLLRGWMRSMLFDEQADEIRMMIRQFGDLLPRPYKAFMWMLTAFPKTTAAGCRMISRIVRFLGLRKRLVRSN